MPFSSAAGMSWYELERNLSGQAPAAYSPPASELVEAPSVAAASAAVTPYAELHAHSNFSFLDGASDPEALVGQAAALGVESIALTDHDGMYGVVRFAEAARELGVRTVFGAELSLGLSAGQSGVADPEGPHLLVLARGPEGYRQLCRVISSAHLRGEEKGRPVYDLDEVVGELAGEVVVLTGCRKGAVRAALDRGGPRAAAAELRRLVGWFGVDQVTVELTDHAMPTDTARNDILAALATDAGLPVVATNAVHYAKPEDGRLAAAMAAVRARRSLDDMDGWLPPAPTAFIRSGSEMADRFARYPGAVAAAAKLGRACSWDMRAVAPHLPPYPVGDGHTEDTWLRHLTMAGAAQRYGPAESHPRQYRQLDHELKVIAQLRFAGYFLIVKSIVDFCRERRILCQGRGSAANSAVCYALGITNADPVEWDLLFERFLAPERDGPPDIDIDIESDRREEVLQHIYTRFGRRNAALVANVITYRTRSAVRDAARALGFSAGQIDQWSKRLDGWGTVASAAAEPDQQVPAPVLALAGEFEGSPRHLGIHSGGMVITDVPVSEIVPVEHARMPGRTVIQWDKDDCAAAGLVKFDLLGLGMLSAISYCLELLREQGVEVDIAHLDLADQQVYDMLCRADTVGVFQVESRAQMATLPRLKPRSFWDLAVEVALIRPGPIQGGSVHPYLKRRDGTPWQYAHPLLARALDRTLGVPLFQEQVMQMAIDVAGFTAAEADQLRRAMSSKRSTARMEQMRERFLAGAATNDVTGYLAEQIFEQVKAFSGYGFPMSHALSFAHIVFVSAYLKCYHPAFFCAALLRAQPMGFYSPQSLVADARRHGITVRGVDITTSAAGATLEPDPGSTGGWAVRLGLSSVRQLGDHVAERIAAERDRGGPYADSADLARRAELTRPHLEALATAGALRWHSSRRAALWAAGAAARDRPGMLPGTAGRADAPALPGMTKVELMAADLWATGLYPVDCCCWNPARRFWIMRAGLEPGRWVVFRYDLEREWPDTPGAASAIASAAVTGLKERGRKQGQPFLIAPSGRPDMRINAYFSSLKMGGKSPLTWKKYSYSLGLWLNFLAVLGREWDTASEEDAEYFKEWRITEAANPERVTFSTFRGDLVALRSFYKWAGPRYGITDPVSLAYDYDLMPHGPRQKDIKWLDPAGWRRWRDLGLRGLDVNGRPDSGFRSRNEQRDVAFAEGLYGTGLRLTEWASVVVCELPDDDPGRGYSARWLANACAKRGHGHKYWIPRRTLLQVLSYLEGARARAVRRAQREGRYERLNRVRLVLDVQREHLVVLEPDGRQTRPTIDAISPAMRRRLFSRTPQGLEPLAVWLNEDGLPRLPHGWEHTFGTANARIARLGFPGLRATPHHLRHSFCLRWYSIGKLVYKAQLEHLSEAERKDFREQFGDTWNLVATMVGHHNPQTTRECYLEPFRSLDVELLLHHAAGEDLPGFLATYLAQHPRVRTDPLRDAG